MIFVFCICPGAAGAGIFIIVPADNVGEFIPEIVWLGVGDAVVIVSCDVVAGVGLDVSAFMLESFLSFFFLPVTIKMINAISNNNTPPVINNPGIDKNQSKLKFI